MISEVKLLCTKNPRSATSRVRNNLIPGWHGSPYIITDYDTPLKMYGHNKFNAFYSLY